MDNELLNHILSEQVNELVHLNTDIIMNAFQSACPGLDENTLAAGIAAIRLSTQFSLYTMIKLFEDVGLLSLPKDGEPILKVLD